MFCDGYHHLTEFRGLLYPILFFWKRRSVVSINGMNTEYSVKEGATVPLICTDIDLLLRQTSKETDVGGQWHYRVVVTEQIDALQ